MLLVPDAYLDSLGTCKYCQNHVILRRPFLVAAIDFETTGLEPATNEILEAGAVIFDAITGHPLARFCELARPSRAFARHPGESNRISNEAVEKCRPISQVLADFVDFISRAKLLIAHNAPFDAAFLIESCTRNGVPVPRQNIVDSLAWVYECIPDAPNHKLKTLIGLYDTAAEGLHRADSDSEGLRIIVVGILKSLPAPQKELTSRAVSLRKMATLRGDSLKILKSNPAWRRQPMSKLQRNNLIELGARLNQLENLTKGQAADLGAKLRREQRITERNHKSVDVYFIIALFVVLGFLLLLALR